MSQSPRRWALALALLVSAPGSALDARAQLNAHQRKVLMDASKACQSVASDTRRYTALIRQLQKIELLHNVKYSVIASLVDKEIPRSRKQLDRAKSRLARLPAADADVATLRGQHKQLSSVVEDYATQFVNLKAKLDTLRDPARWPDVTARTALMTRMGQLLDPEMLSSDHLRSAEIVPLWPRMAGSYERWWKRYTPLIAQQTVQGKTFGQAALAFTERHYGFADAAGTFLDRGLEALARELDAAHAAAESKNGARWVRDVHPRLQIVAARLAALEAVADPKIIALQLKAATRAAKTKADYQRLLEAAKVRATRQLNRLRELKKRQRTYDFDAAAMSQRDAIAAAASLPTDAYVGADRESLTDAVSETLGAAPQKLILTEARWRPERSLRWSAGSWQPVERQRLHAVAVVRSRAGLALRRLALVREGDRLTAERLPGPPLPIAKEKVE